MSDESVNGLDEQPDVVIQEQRREMISSQEKARATAAGIWSRVGLLLFALCVIKAVMLVGFRKHLYETHWRVSAVSASWLDPLAFYLFALLVGGNIWALGRRCASRDLRTVRAANAFVLLFGGLFIFLTFHEGDWNYLSPVMNGILRWQDLGAYLNLNFFFRPPYLALWIGGYAAIYYVLVRTNCESRIFGVTALCSMGYTMFCLRDLAVDRGSLFYLNCIGIVCFIFGISKRRDGLGLIGLCLWLLLPLSFFLLLSSVDPKIAYPRPEFVVLTGVSVVIFGGVTLLVWRRGFSSVWSWGLPFTFCSFLLLINQYYTVAPNYQNFLSLGLSLPRYFLGEIGISALVAIAALAYRQWRRNGTLWWLDVLNGFLIALALIDLKISQVMGIRFDFDVLSLALGETPKMMWRMSEPYLPSVLVIWFAGVGVYIGCLYLVRRFAAQQHIRSLVDRNFNPKFLFPVLLLLGVAGAGLAANDKVEGESIFLLAKTSPLWRRATATVMDKQQFLKSATELGMKELASTPQNVSIARERPLNVVLIFQESTYNKYLSLFGSTNQTQPMLSSYSDRMELFPNFFSNFAGSIHARFATFTGLYPVRDYKAFTLNRVPVESVFEILHDRGYSNSLFYSSFFDYTGFGDFLKGRKIAEMYDAQTMPGERKTPAVSWGLHEDETLRAMRSKINDYASHKQKFFLTYVPAAPHNPFDGTPVAFRKHRIEKIGDFTPLFLNELLYMDWVITSIIDELKQSGVLDNTLVIITSDHGEMLGNNGPVGHGWAVTPELANVPLIIMDPAQKGMRINSTVGSQVDILPTLLDLLGIPVPAEQLYQGSSLYSQKANADRTIYLNSFQEFGIISDNRFACGKRDAVAQTLYRIGIEAGKPVFEPLKSSATTFTADSEFNSFQDSFLRYYSRYCELVRGR